MKPWEMRETESASDFERFRVYLELGPGRSLAKLNAALSDGETSVSRRQMERISSQHDWVERCRAWDEENAREIMSRAQEIQEATRAILFAGAAKASAYLARVAAGEIKNPSPASISAAKDLLDRVGLGAEKKVSVQHGFSDAADTAAERAASTLGASTADLAVGYEGRTGGGPGRVPGEGDRR